MSNNTCTAERGASALLARGKGELECVPGRTLRWACVSPYRASRFEELRDFEGEPDNLKRKLEHYCSEDNRHGSLSQNRSGLRLGASRTMQWIISVGVAAQIHSIQVLTRSEARKPVFQNIHADAPHQVEVAYRLHQANPLFSSPFALVSTPALCASLTCSQLLPKCSLCSSSTGGTTGRSVRAGGVARQALIRLLGNACENNAGTSDGKKWPSQSRSNESPQQTDQPSDKQHDRDDQVDIGLQFYISRIKRLKT